MNFDELLAPSVNQAETPSVCEISKLADVDLVAIFKRLPPIDRLLVSEVCKRWHAIAKQAWLEITHLDLSPIPGPNIVPIIRLCPNLRHVSAVRKTFDLNELKIFSRINLSSLTLYECSCINLPATVACRNDPLAAVFSRNLRSARMDELVVHELTLSYNATEECPGKVVDLPASFPASLKRLQLSGVIWFPGHGEPRRCLRGVDQLRDLECLILLGRQKDVAVWPSLADPRLLASIASLQGLRELALGSNFPWGYTNHDLMRPISSLPRLEALFLDKFAQLNRHREDFANLVTKHPTLRIFVLTGHIGYNVRFPARVDPLLKLHIFVGKSASEEILFPKFPSDAAKVYPISEPLPLFLSREDIAPIFKGVWIAEKIKEAVELGAEFCDYRGDIATSFRSSDT